ncbi:GNAT family N-acetyltransferase [Buttiauxella gaviniae]|uniref:GNAT family N-acetyltransferase n=1 Tax=Buttiauxella gaviniae TaxID=82990 RepID=UPI0039B05AC6
MNDNEGKTILLTPVTSEVESAEHIIRLRNGEKQIKFLSQTDFSVEKQLHWLKEYAVKNNNNEQYYFFIIRKDTQEVIGTVRIYDIKNDIKSFCWGSWILNDNKTISSALESFILINRFAFEVLGCKQAHFDVRKNNEKVIAFHLKTGAKIIREDVVNYYFNYFSEDFAAFKNKHIGMIK